MWLGDSINEDTQSVTLSYGFSALPTQVFGQPLMQTRVRDPLIAAKSGRCSLMFQNLLCPKPLFSHSQPPGAQRKTGQPRGGVSCAGAGCKSAGGCK